MAKTKKIRRDLQWSRSVGLSNDRLHLQLASCFLFQCQVLQQQLQMKRPLR